MQLIPPPEAFELVDLIVVVVAVGGRKILFSCCAKTEKHAAVDCNCALQSQRGRRLNVGL